MITYKYYKFPSKEYVPKIWPTNVNISEIGLIKENDAIYDNEGNEIEPIKYKEGWHVNICYQGNADLSGIESFEITVLTPNRLWFGQQVQ